MNGLVVAEFLGLLLFTAGLLWYYASKHTHWVYLLAVGASWYLGFFGTLLLPVDVEETLDSQPQEWAMDLWLFTYWVTFMLSWVILPVLMEFYASGAFTFKERLKYSLRSNLKFYVVVLLLLVVFIVWMAISNSWGPTKLSGFLIAAANTYGMLLIVVMLGYGLVEAPRALWIKSDPRRALTRLEFRAPDLEENLFDAKCIADECVQEARRLSRLIPAEPTDEEGKELRRCMNIVLMKLPAEATGASAGVAADSAAPSLKSLAAVHTKLIKAIPQLEKCQAQWDSLVKDASELQSVIEGGEQPTDYDSAHPEGRVQTCLRRLSWLHKSKMSWWFNKAAAVVLAIMSALVLWCELAIPLPWDLSMFGLLVHGVQGSFAKQLFAFLPFAYISTCMYLALFRVKFFSAITLTGGRLTNAYALMFNASYLCRLQFVLAFNYLLVLKTGDTTSAPTAFERSVGAHMQLVPVFGSDFNNFIPILLLIFAILSLLRVVDRIVRKIGIEGFGEYVPGRLDHEEKVKEGQEFIQKAKDRAFRSGRGGRGGGAAESKAGRSARTLARAHEMASSMRAASYTPPSAPSSGGSDTWAGLNP